MTNIIVPWTSKGFVAMCQIEKSVYTGIAKPTKLLAINNLEKKLNECKQSGTYVYEKDNQQISFVVK